MGVIIGDGGHNVGGGRYTPVLWPEVVLGKDMTLNFNNMGPVAKYVSYLFSPNALDSTAGLQAPILFLRALFNRL